MDLGVIGLTFSRIENQVIFIILVIFLLKSGLSSFYSVLLWLLTLAALRLLICRVMSWFLPIFLFLFYWETPFGKSVM